MCHFAAYWYNNIGVLQFTAIEVLFGTHKGLLFQLVVLIGKCQCTTESLLMRIMAVRQVFGYLKIITL